MPARASAAVATIMLASVALLACTAVLGTVKTDGLAASPASVGPGGGKPPASPVTKVLVFVEENHSLSQMQTGMPYAYSLAQQYGYADTYTATTHPSLPNYIAIVSGDTYGIADDEPPTSHPLAGSTVFGTALQAGRTAKVYADGMQSNCAQVDGGSGYAVKHNPWVYFTSISERSGCNANDVPETQLRGDITAGMLPNVGMVIPNLCNDAHDCPLGTADQWFQARMQAIFAGPDWTAGRLAVILTADEDDRNSGNTVLTVVVHPSQHANVVSTALTHYSLTRFLNDVGHSPKLGGAATAPSLSSAFGLNVG